MTSKIADGFHGNEGRKLTNAYCELQDVPAFGSFIVDQVPYKQMNISQTTYEE